MATSWVGLGSLLRRWLASGLSLPLSALGPRARWPVSSCTWAITPSSHSSARWASFSPNTARSRHITSAISLHTSPSATIEVCEDSSGMYVAEPIRWSDSGVVMLDQRRLPTEETYYTYTTYQDVAKSIKEMVIRGAPAIGVAAAMGVAIGLQKSTAKSLAELRAEFPVIADTLAKTRPTAVDLFWALERMKHRFAELTARSSDLAQIKRAMVDEAKAVHAEKRSTDEAMGRFGAEFMPREGYVMTQCNAGALATAGIGSALGVIQVAVEQGKKLHVYVPETRPYLQGARLTAWELYRSHIPLTLITANKIGTYQIAVLAREHGVPFYIAAPVSTFDLSIASGEQIPIEERSSAEVTEIRGVRIAPDVRAAHPAFDVTPSRYIAAIFTERGVARAPYGESLQALARARSLSAR